MSNDLEQWQWVDEDPFEKLLRAPKKDQDGTPAASPIECLEHLHFEEVPCSNPTIMGSEPEQSVAPFDPAVRAEPAPVPDSYPAVLAAEPSDPPTAHFDLAVSLEKLEQWEGAADSFRRAVDLEPAHAEALIGLGACLLHLERAEEALHYFEQCLFLDAERNRALLGKAVSLQKLECYDDADRVYRELLQITPDAPEPLANLIALSVTRRDTSAIAEFSRKLLRVDARHKSALQGLATLAIWDGDQMAAVDYCRRLVQVDPDCFEGWHNLGFANQGMRPAEQAMRSIA